jgi:hypothetical protein
VLEICRQMGAGIWEVSKQSRHWIIWFGVFVSVIPSSSGRAEHRGTIRDQRTYMIANILLGVLGWPGEKGTKLYFESS